MKSPTEAARQVLRTLFLEWKLCIPRLLMSSCNEHLRAGSRCWMIIAILRPVDHKRRVELERGEETHLRDSRTDYYDKSRVVSRIHNGNELVLELVMNLNQVQEGHVFSITQRSTAMSNWARVVYTIIHVQSRRQECCFYDDDDAPTYYPACCPICDIATNNVNPFWTAVDASPSWPHLHFCPFP